MPRSSPESSFQRLWLGFLGARVLVALALLALQVAGGLLQQPADLRLLLPKPGEVPLAQLSQADSQGHHGALHLLLQQCMQGGLALSEALTQRYFTHTSVVTHQTMRRLHEGMPA